MKRLLKIFSFLFLAFCCSFIGLSLLVSNERSVKWLLYNISEELGYESEIKSVSVDWSFNRSIIDIKKIKVSPHKSNFIQSSNVEEILINIDLFALISFKHFTEVQINKATLNLTEGNVTTGLSRNKISRFFLDRVNFFVEEVRVTGYLTKLDIYNYFFLFRESEQKRIFRSFIIDNLLVGNLSLGPLSFEEVTLSMEPKKEKLVFDVSSSEVNGLVVLNLPITKGIEIDLNQVNIERTFINSKENIFNYLLNNLEIPIHFSTKSFTLNDSYLGSWKFSVHKKENNLFFDEIEGLYSNSKNSNLEKENSKIKPRIIIFSTSSDMAIKANSKGLITTITGRISSDSLDKFFEFLYEDESKSNVLANKFLIETELSWKGLPNDFNIEKSEGNLYFSINDLLIKEFDEDMSQFDLLRLVSLFNVAHTFEGLTNLNFRRNFRSGFQAEKVRGGIKIGSKRLETIDPIIFETGAGNFSWHGYVTKNSQGNFKDLDFEIIMTLPIKEYLPAYALILGGPVTAGMVYIAGKVFERPLNKLSSGKWRVSGNVKEFKAEFIEWFE